MLTRLKVNGFKNLVDVDVRFGPFTCIAGQNGVGKSNLFDAIRFLSALSEQPLSDAAAAVRGERGKPADVRQLFHRVGDHHDPRMTFEVEMIVPKEAIDDLGQTAVASATFLRYALELGYRNGGTLGSSGVLEIRRERLEHIPRNEASSRLQFPHSVRKWRRSVLAPIAHHGPYISTATESSGAVILVHPESSGRELPLSRPASKLPRTVLSVSNAAESPTATVARREMQSWRLLQLEPSALRKPDDFGAKPLIAPSGDHLPSALYHLANTPANGGTEALSSNHKHSAVYAKVANRLTELIDDVREVWVDPDEKRETLTLNVQDRSGTIYPARSLSDGTLRFLALAVLEIDSETKGLLCLEEPENGIHPRRIPAMLELLEDIAVDVTDAVSVDNPLRQVIVNTHSPVVVKEIQDGSLMVAELVRGVQRGQRFPKLQLSCLPGTWRAEHGECAITSRGSLLAYLNPNVWNEDAGGAKPPPGRRSRVMDRPDMRSLLSSQKPE